MIDVSGNTITMTRGDTFRAVIEPKTKSGEVYHPADGDSIKFTAKRYYTDNVALIEKQIRTETMLLEILPDETKQLQQPASLVYDIQLTHADGTVDTFISGKIHIKPEVG